MAKADSRIIEAREKAFSEAIEVGDIPQINALVELGVNLNPRKEGSWSRYLVRAGRSGKTEVIDALVKHGAQGLDEALLAATQEGHAEASDAIIRHGASLDAIHKALLLAVSEKYVNVLERIAAYVPTLDHVRDQDGNTPLITLGASWSFRRSGVREDIVKAADFLLKRDADPRLANDYGETAAFHAREAAHHLRNCSPPGNNPAIAAEYDKVVTRLEQEIANRPPLTTQGPKRTRKVLFDYTDWHP